MDKKHEALAVFTMKSFEDIMAVGGSESWVLAERNAMKCEFVVCCRSQHSLDRAQPPGSAFLIGRIAGIGASGETEGRYRIKISEFAHVNIPDVWKGWRNPVRYAYLEDLGIDLEGLIFEPMRPLTPPADSKVSESAAVGQGGFTQAASITIPEAIAQAKRALAQTCGVGEDAVEITVRW